MPKFTETQKRVFEKIKVGQVINGKVKSFKNYGAFINLGMIDGLLATKDISWGRVDDPEDVLKLYQRFDVVVLSKDNEKYTISLGRKQLLPYPWEVAKSKYKEGDTVVGQVVDVQPYGAFLQIFPGFEGLVHVSEISSEDNPVDPKSFFEQGQSYEATIIKLDFSEKKMSLSIK